MNSLLPSRLPRTSRSLRRLVDLPLRTRGTTHLVALLVLPLPAGPVRALALAKFEPARGCYIGAFVEKDDQVRGDYTAFERLTGKKHASYFTYVGYGRPFPAQWVRKVKAAAAAPHIALEPNEGLARVKDDAYLREWAQAAYRADCPIFLRFASEMNGAWSAYHGNPPLFRAKFRLVHDVMARFAPNVAMVWTPFATPQRNIPDYYPGDDYVDWVGVNIYSVYVHNGDPTRPAAHEDPVAFLRFIYDLYADRKPIQVSEFAATHFCRAVQRSTESFAVAKMKRFYQAIAEEFPRVKMINWFSFDSLRHGIADNDYSLTDNEAVLKTYRRLIASDYFLTSVAYDRDKYRLPQHPGEVSGPVLVAATSPRVPPPLPDVRPPAPTLGLTPEWTEADWVSLLSRVGGNATQTSGLRLIGIRPGQVVRGTVELRVALPPHVEAVYAVLEVDGRAVHATNIKPFRFTFAPERLVAGPHRARIIVTDRDGNDHPSRPVPFQTAK